MSEVSSPAEPEIRRELESAFSDADIQLHRIDFREYPGETVVLVKVDSMDIGEAARVGNDVDQLLAEKGFRGFVAVRPLEPEEGGLPTGALSDGVHDPRVAELVRLLTARSRTSQIQPSLSYIANVSARVSTVASAQHHLVFGRRGAGKTALMVEAMRIADAGHQATAWVNLQTYRREAWPRVFLFLLAQLLKGVHKDHPGADSSITRDFASVDEEVTRLLGAQNVTATEAERLAPRVNLLLRQYLSATDTRLFLFLDDFHYLSRDDQPYLLDILHACVRDADAWLKVAGIRHLTRWFISHPPTGLQTGHDVRILDLDVTLQDPAVAKSFLEDVLRKYGEAVNIGTLGGVFSQGSLDRLVLASGAVPRDYLVLASEAIVRAQSRSHGKLVGIQDVNSAAGDAAQSKIQELEDDLAAHAGTATATLAGLQVIRRFCLDDKKFTYFRVDFKDKETRQPEYAVLEHLLDVRLIHLVNPSVSDERRAGERSEVYMLDLSQFSGQRLKKFIRVLDFVQGSLASKETGRRGSTRIGDTPKKLLSILRRGPTFELELVSPITDDVGSE